MKFLTHASPFTPLFEEHQKSEMENKTAEKKRKNVQVLMAM